MGLGQRDFHPGVRPPAARPCGVAGLVSFAVSLAAGFAPIPPNSFGEAGLAGSALAAGAAFLTSSNRSALALPPAESLAAASARCRAGRRATRRARPRDAPRAWRAHEHVVQRRAGDVDHGVLVGSAVEPYRSGHVQFDVIGQEALGARAAANEQRVSVAGLANPMVGVDEGQLRGVVKLVDQVHRRSARPAQTIRQVFAGRPVGKKTARLGAQVDVEIGGRSAVERDQIDRRDPLAAGGLYGDDIGIRASATRRTAARLPPLTVLTEGTPRPEVIDAGNAEG